MENEQLTDLSQHIQELIEELDDIKDELSDLLEELEEEAAESASCDEETGIGDIYPGLRNIYDLVEKSYIHLNEAEEQLDDMF